MQHKLVSSEANKRTFILVLAPGEEAFATITAFAERERISGASLTALGAFERAKIGWFDLESRQYHPIYVNEQAEVLSIIGDIAIGDNGNPTLHMHTVLGLKDGTTRGGHLMEGIVRPTLELILAETEQHLRRRQRPEFGIALIDLS
jgi:predicted DNA-binding protein with PD1-like motif